MKILNRTRNTELAQVTEVAASFWTRIKGLLGKKELPPHHALVLRPCNSIHTFGMRFPIDALFVDKEDVVVGVIADMLPGRASRLYQKAHYVIELPSGTASATSTCVGDQLGFD